MRLNYIAPGMEAPQAVEIDSDAPYILNWVYWMIRDNPGSIFFYTMDTTDIWDDGDYIINHVCSCHAKQWGPCTVCRQLGCEVWNYNPVAQSPPLPADHMGPEFNHGFHYESIFIQDSTEPPVV
jgi:hypothetical protein